jgi:hypothetical protein
MVHEVTIILDYALLLSKVISLENWDLIVIWNLLACPDLAKEVIWIKARFQSRIYKCNEYGWFMRYMKHKTYIKAAVNLNSLTMEIQRE